MSWILAMNAVINEKKRPETEIFLEIIQCTKCVSGNTLCKTHAQKVKQILLDDVNGTLEKFSASD